MNYQKIYDNLIRRGKDRILPSFVYREKHHIIPKCLGGLNNLDNLVELTAEEHYVAHQLLVKLHPSNKRVIHAAVIMTWNLKGKRRNNKEYAWLKKKHADAIRESGPANMKKFWDSEQGKLRRLEHNKIISNNTKLLWQNPKYQEKFKSALKRGAETRRKKWKEDPIWAAELNKKRSNTAKLLQTPERRKKISDAAKQRMKDRPELIEAVIRTSQVSHTCPYCNKTGRGNRMINHISTKRCQTNNTLSTI